MIDYDFSIMGLPHFVADNWPVKKANEFINELFICGKINEIEYKILSSIIQDRQDREVRA